MLHTRLTLPTTERTAVACATACHLPRAVHAPATHLQFWHLRHTTGLRSDFWLIFPPDGSPSPALPASPNTVCCRAPFPFSWRYATAAPAALVSVGSPFTDTCLPLLRWIGLPLICCATYRVLRSTALPTRVLVPLPVPFCGLDGTTFLIPRTLPTYVPKPATLRLYCVLCLLRAPSSRLPAPTHLPA